MAGARVDDVHVEIAASVARDLMRVEDFLITETLNAMRVQIVRVIIHIVPLDAEPQYAVHPAASILDVLADVAVGHVARIRP